MWVPVVVGSSSATRGSGVYCGGVSVFCLVPCRGIHLVPVAYNIVFSTGAFEIGVTFSSGVLLLILWGRRGLTCKIDLEVLPIMSLL